MAKRLMTGFCVLMLTGIAGAQEGDQQPLERAKVGDYVVFKMIGSVPGTITQEVVAVTDKDVTIRFTSVFNGLAQKPTEQTFPKTQKADPAQKAKNLKIVEAGTGQETLKIGGKDYRCACGPRMSIDPPHPVARDNGRSLTFRKNSKPSIFL